MLLTAPDLPPPLSFYVFIRQLQYTYMPGSIIPYIPGSIIPYIPSSIIPYIPGSIPSSF